MKKIIITTLTLISFYSCIAQNGDQGGKLNIPHYQDKQKDTISVLTYLSTAFITGWGGTSDTTIRKIDTIPVILLVCDTAKKGDGKSKITFSIFYNAEKPEENVGTSVNHVPYVFWIKGYEAREIVNHFLEKIYYLDENKKPLKKNIVVWLSK